MSGGYFSKGYLAELWQVPIGVVEAFLREARDALRREGQRYDVVSLNDVVYYPDDVVERAEAILRATRGEAAR